MKKLIPVLPCSDKAAQIAFYKHLGFELVGEHERSYIVVKRAEIELHFYGTKQVAPEHNSSMCLIQTDDVDALHHAFESGLMAGTGRVPRTGFPKITMVRDLKDDRRFTLTDPSGNTFYVLTPKTAGDGTFFRDLSEEQHRKAFAALYDLVYSKEDMHIAGNLLPKLLAVKKGLCDLDRAKLCLVEMEMCTKQQRHYQDDEIMALIKSNHGSADWEKVMRQYKEKGQTDG